MLLDKHLQIIRATAPVVAENINTITQLFYKSMFKNNPETLAFFNPAHQFNLQQPKALANAVVGYATALVEGKGLERLGSAVELIAQKHCALQILPEHYSIVGTNLMKAIHEVLGSAVTQDVHESWESAYLQLADILIKREKEIYDDQENRFGWRGYRSFVVKKIVDEGENVRSFYLYPKEGELKSHFRPGQYVTIKFNFDQVTAPRNYTISSVPGLPYFRISVKKVEPRGVYSSYIHENISVGSEISVAPPAGEFALQPFTEPGKNIVFLSAGVGVTPFVSMSAEAVANTGNSLFWIHSSRGSVMPLRGEVPPSVRLLHLIDTTKSTRLSSQMVLELVPHTDSDFYVCGPRDFIIEIVRGLSEKVPLSQIRYEFFGPLASFSK